MPSEGTRQMKLSAASFACTFILDIISYSVTICAVRLIKSACWIQRLQNDKTPGAQSLSLQGLNVPTPTPCMTQIHAPPVLPLRYVGDDRTSLLASSIRNAAAWAYSQTVINVLLLPVSVAALLYVCAHDLQSKHLDCFANCLHAECTALAEELRMTPAKLPLIIQNKELYENSLNWQGLSTMTRQAALAMQVFLK